MLLKQDFLEKWEKIVDDVDKDLCPIQCVKKIIFRTKDKTQKTINLKQMRRQGFDDDTIENMVSDYISLNQPMIKSMEFILDVEAVADLIQPQTDNLLKGLK